MRMTIAAQYEDDNSSSVETVGLVAAGPPQEKEEQGLEEGSGSPSNCEPPPGPKYAEASIIFFSSALVA
jgi:hypothetical protein